LPPITILPENCTSFASIVNAQCSQSCCSPGLYHPLIWKAFSYQGFALPENCPDNCPAAPFAWQSGTTNFRECWHHGSPESAPSAAGFAAAPPTPWSKAMKKIILSSLVLFGLSGAAMAQAATDFASVDTDVSGGVSLAEAQVAWPDLTEEAFTTADADGNGELSVDEFATLSASAGAGAAADTTTAPAN
jgi:hypothetical protein